MLLYDSGNKSIGLTVCIKTRDTFDDVGDAVRGATWDLDEIRKDDSVRVQSILVAYMCLHAIRAAFDLAQGIEA